MPEVGWLIAAASLVLVGAGYVGSTWGRVTGLRNDLEDARNRDADHLADLAEMTAALAVARTEIGELSSHVSALQVSLTGRVEWAEVVRILGEIKALLEARP